MEPVNPEQPKKAEMSGYLQHQFLTPCPACGHCPTCGRGPSVPVFAPQPVPFWVGPTIVTCGPQTSTLGDSPTIRLNS